MSPDVEPQLAKKYKNIPRAWVGWLPLNYEGWNLRSRDVSKDYALRANLVRQGARCNAGLTYAVRQRQQRRAPEQWYRRSRFVRVRQGGSGLVTVNATELLPDLNEMPG